MSASKPTNNGKAAKNKGQSAADRLMKAADAIELFHDPQRRAFATTCVNGHQETYAIGSKSFCHWLSRTYYRATQQVPSSQAMTDALNGFKGQALHDGPEISVHLRIAEYEGLVYLDLGNRDWQCVEISPGGWRVVDDAPVRFRRPSGMQALPTPEPGGSIDELSQFINITNDEDFLLFVGFLVQCLRPTGPYFILILLGEHGSAKSTAVRVGRRLVDPNISPLRSEQREVRDLMIMAHNSHVLTLDNLSRIPDWISDTLCRLTSGGGFSVRQLYTDDEEAIFDSSRPIILNSIEELDTRSDLHDRSIRLTLPTIPDDERRSERELWADFDSAQARILGSLLDATSAALRNLDRVQFDQVPRMVDAIHWVEAAAPVLEMEQGDFLEAVKRNRESGHALALDASPIASTLLTFIDSCDGEPRAGTAEDLLTALDLHAGYESEDGKASRKRPKGWPTKPHMLGSHLRRIAPDLRAVGVTIDFFREPTAKRRRIIQLGRIPDPEAADGEVVSSDSALGGLDDEEVRQDGSDALDTNLRFSEHAAKAGREVYSV